jgi:transposase-like protein
MNRKEDKRYSREFKLEAVRLAAFGERPKAQIARELGISLRKWRLEFEAEERVRVATGLLATWQSIASEQGRSSERGTAQASFAQVIAFGPAAG